MFPSKSNLISGIALTCCLLVAPALFNAAPAQASALIETNKAGVKVDSQAASARKGAQTQALQRVFIKMTGDKSVLDNAGVKTALRSPSQYLVSYEYQTRDGQLYYVAEFSRQSLVRILQRESLSLWGQRRPDTLLWLAGQDDSGQRWILREEQQDDTTRQLRQVSQARGVPVSLPLMDLTDAGAISVTDVWGQFTGVLRRASERYQPDLILGVRLHPRQADNAGQFLTTEERLEQALSNSNLAFAYEQGQPSGDEQAEAASDLNEQDVLSESEDMIADTPVEPAPKIVSMAANAGQGDIAADWVLLDGKRTQFGTYYGSTGPEAVANLMDAYADYLGQRFAVGLGSNGANAGTLRISVANLDSLRKYVHAQRFLSELSVIKSAAMVSQDGPVAQFDIALTGSVDDFNNALSLESRLRPVTDALGRPLEGFNFYWNE
ncbi:DUF2066 domain-containing protein [Salinimonas lutimaris]|uniref:DUF2066 domain-containing protein n=1 Tax=Salinimonas lutimaris TaxID=914153 RepID=UPI0010BFC578|nr:DUF2066 domain-containing protein [Salinimonas lutimaris]